MNRVLLFFLLLIYLGNSIGKEKKGIVNRIKKINVDDKKRNGKKKKCSFEKNITFKGGGRGFFAFKNKEEKEEEKRKISNFVKESNDKWMFIVEKIKYLWDNKKTGILFNNTINNDDKEKDIPTIPKGIHFRREDGYGFAAAGSSNNNTTCYCLGMYHRELITMVISTKTKRIYEYPENGKN